MAKFQTNTQKLEEDIDLYVKTFAKAYAHEAAKEITKLAQLAIQRFYDDYTPRYYNRTDDLLKNSYKPYVHNNGRAIYGGVVVTHKNMDEYRGAGISTEEIANATWRWGCHGYEKRELDRRINTFPPFTMVQMAAGDQDFQKMIFDRAQHVALRQKYKVLGKHLKGGKA